MPALVAWGGGWAVLLGAARLGLPFGAALLAGLVPALLVLRLAAPGWRRLVVLAGLPLSVLLVLGAGAVPAWAWLVAAVALVVIYPIQAWRDAPLFPTPRDALTELPRKLSLGDRARVLDAGSGLGDGLIALRRAYPQALLVGVEGGFLMAVISRLRLRLAGVRDASIRRGDFWRTDWSTFDLVYVFQRPETMPRAWAKACQDMKAGAWLVSLEFEVPDIKPHTRLRCPDGRALWVYRVH
jgi:hypothetical protein